MRTFYLILSILCLSSCVNMGAQRINNQDAPAMKGQSAEVLTSRWGKPSLVGQAANGNKEYAYITQSSDDNASARSEVLTGSTLGRHSSTGDKNTVKQKCTSLFEIDQQSIIVSAKNHGNC